MTDHRLYRSRTERMIGGVCSGLGKYLGLDPTIVRLIFVLLFISGSAGFWAYLILLIVVPEEPEPNTQGLADSEEEKKE